MSNIEELTPPSKRPKPVLPLISLTLLFVAWGFIAAGRYRVSQLDLTRFGRDQDIFEAMNRDAYIGGVLWPYFTIACLLDLLAVILLFKASEVGQYRPVGIRVTVLCVPSVAWQGVVWLVYTMFG
jgi:hypothetical protein